MQSTIINYLFPGNAVQVLFYTLMHSLWQAVVFALLAAIILVLTKNSGAALRYKLLGAVLVAFVAVTLFTCCYEVYSVVHSGNAPAHTAVVASNNITVVHHRPVSFVEKLIAVVQPYKNIVVLAWLSIILIKAIGLINGIYGVYILKHRQVVNAGNYWNERIHILAKKAGVKTPVILLKSFIAKVPVVVGYIKPVILFPAAAFTALTTEEVEAILLHELAHIQRKDYLINIFQRVAEIIFFFNPAVLWISSLIKQERENCCDDIAVQQTKDKKQFIHALVSFQEYNTSVYAASFSGRKNFLLNRVKRIITNNNKTLNNMEKSFLMAGIIITAGTAFAFSQHQQSVTGNNFEKPIQLAHYDSRRDTVPQQAGNSNYTFSSDVNGKQYKLVEVNGKLTELYVDNVKIPADKFSDYDSVINKLNEQLRAANNHNEAAAAENALILSEKLATNAEAKKDIKAMQAQAKELKQQMAQFKTENDSDAIQSKMAALNAQAELLQQKALAINEPKDDVIKLKLHDLKAEQANIQVQAEKLAELQKLNEPVQLQLEKLAEISEEQALTQTKNAKQFKIMTDEKQKAMNEQLEKKVEQLKRENEALKQQLRYNTDTLRLKPATP